MVSQAVRYGPWMPRLARRSCRVAVFALESKHVALCTSIAGVAFLTNGCLPSGGRARSESVSASCAMVGWALEIGLIDLPFSNWTHITFKHPLQNGKAGAQSDHHIFANDGLPLQPQRPILETTDSAQTLGGLSG